MAKAVKSDSDKSKLDLLKEELEKKFGKGTIVSGNSKKDFEVISTGSLRLNKATDCGGLPRGKLIEIFGPESSGKSTLTMHFIAEFQKAGLRCIYADYEHSFDKNYAEKIGVDTEALIIMQPNTMEDGYNMIYEYIRSGEIGLIVIDSHTAMVPKQRFDGEIGDAKMAPEARVNSDGLKKIKADIEKYNCTVIGISQLRAAIGKMNAGNEPTGGNAWKFYTDMRLKVYKILDRVNETNDTTIEVIKNKCGKPFGKCEVPIAWGIGLDKKKEVLEIATELNIIVKSGSWYSYDGNKLGQGASAVMTLFNDNIDFYEEVKGKVEAAYKKVEIQIVKPQDDAAAEAVPTEAINNENVQQES